METLRSEIEFERVNKNPVNSLTAVYILIAMKLPVIEAESSFGAPMVVHSLWSLTRVKSCNGCMVNHYMTLCCCRMTLLRACFILLKIKNRGGLSPAL